MADKLALLGGSPVIRETLKPYTSIGAEEERAVIEVIRSGTLSGFMGSPGPEFFGGPKVREFEAKWRQKYNCRHAVSVNSATSGLIAAMGAIGLSPGDEVIVPPYTMSATAMAPIFYGGIPVFADIEAETLCLDPEKVEVAITSRTRAILTVNLFGRPGNLMALRAIADRHGIFLIEDAAQSPYAMESGHLAGLVGDIGVYSLNYHKHIHTGEGGICVTNDDLLGRKLSLIRNHGENVTSQMNISDLTNMIGANYRMTELSAAVGMAQLDNIDKHLARCEQTARALNETVSRLDGFIAPQVPEGWRHNYYCWPLRINEGRLGIKRATLAQALRMEGMPFREGYMKPLYNLPVFQERRAIGRDGWPFTLSNRTYEPGMCPVTEKVEQTELLLFLICAIEIDPALRDKFCLILEKVHTGLPALQAWENSQEKAI